ncbi:HEAT repeat domain-containing protein [bacterium]|nr:HEAT repeat domain-containing protein [bacterium]
MKRYLIILLVVSIAVVFLTSETVRSKTKDELSVVINKIIKVLKYGDENFEKPDAVVALGMIGDPRAVEPLMEHLKYSKNDHLRTEIIKALGRIGDKRATPALINVLESDSPSYMRAAAAKALGEIGDRRAVPALEKALKDKYSYTRSQAAQSLKKITGKDYTYEKGSPLKEAEEMMKEIKEMEKELPK